MTKKQTYLDILTIIALLFVAICNISSDTWNSISFGSDAWNYYGWLTVLTQLGIPLLIALFGIELFGKEMNYSNHTVYCKLLPQVTLSCVFWWIIVALIYMGTNFANELDVDTFMECMSQVLRSPYNISLLQLIVMLVAFYPLLARIVRNEKLLLYAMLVSFVVTMIIPVMESIPYVRRLNLFLNQINWGFFSAYGVYLFIGYWATKTSFDWHHRIVIYCSGLLSTVAMFSLTKVFSASVADVDSRFINIDSPFIAIQVLAIIVFAKSVFKKEISNKHINDILNYIAGNKYAFIALYAVGFTITSHYVGEHNSLLLVVGTYVSVNLICLFLRRLPLLSYLLADFKNMR